MTIVAGGIVLVVVMAIPASIIGVACFILGGMDDRRCKRDEKELL